jgi:hypothetical protein
MTTDIGLPTRYIYIVKLHIISRYAQLAEVDDQNILAARWIDP